MLKVYSNEVEKWYVFEAELVGPSEGNPFVEQSLQGRFVSAHESKVVDGFYDGDGVYRVRFMPSFEGEYNFAITGSFIEGEETGSFLVTKPTGNNHGMVRVANRFHFAYEDGTPYYSIGTTAYVWTHQSEDMQEETLNTLRESAFNKIRFCIFPKHYDYNFHEPITYPYEGTPVDSSGLNRSNFMKMIGSGEGNNWDFMRFNPEHFRRFEMRIEDLMHLGIEADLIVMHPYDRWGFSTMSPEADDLYWKYVIARFSAYRNVWWSLANEYDLMKKTLADWERYATIIVEKDPYGHLRSIHNCGPFYDHTRPWITHCSIQRQDPYKSGELVTEWRQRFQKPIVLDEICYEGNIQHGWGNISAQELVRRFWEATCRGGYAGHGETYLHPENRLWWSHGGKLHGESPERFKFLAKILNEMPLHGLMPAPRRWDDVTASTEFIFPVGDFYLIYYGFNRPSFREFDFQEDKKYEVDVIDTWNMTIERVGVFSGHFEVPLPGREYMAIRLRAVE